MAVLGGNDFKAIRELIEVAVEDVIERKELVTKADLGHLPTKDEFYGKMDEVMGELIAIREEQTVQSQHPSFRPRRQNSQNRVSSGHVFRLVFHPKSLSPLLQA